MLTKSKRRWLLLIVPVLGAIFLSWRLVMIKTEFPVSRKDLETENKIPNRLATALPTVPQTEKSDLLPPVDEFTQRITKKPFAIYITPQNSPVMPERFAGYHTGVDVEFEDKSEPVPVYAVTDAEVVRAEWVSGYGGLMVLKAAWDGRDYYFYYGHLDPGSMIQEKLVKKGRFLANLGQGYTQATDGERKHLHFGISVDELDIRGYVDSETDLARWLDPGELYAKVNE